VLHLPLPGPIRPYAGLGFGATTYDFSGSIRSHTSRMATSWGLALELGEGRSLRVQARDFMTPVDSALPGVDGGWQNDLMITAGMSWRVPLGRRSAPRLPPGRTSTPAAAEVEEVTAESVRGTRTPSHSTFRVEPRASTEPFPDRASLPARHLPPMGRDGNPERRGYEKSCVGRCWQRQS
jgi:hypothetical protein